MPVAQQLYLEVLATIGVSIIVCSCALYSPSGAEKVIKTCYVPTDQATTLSGHWANIPIPIAFHQGDFTASEMLSMTNAADTWNKFYTASQGHTAIDYGGSAASPRLSASPDANLAGTLCYNGIMQAGAFNGNVVIYKLGSWPFAANAMALTQFCKNSATPLPNFYMAVLEINYQNFFVDGVGKYPDLTSIILHEFGHLAGLNHSCEGSAKSGTPNCNDPSLNPDYAAASMFPSFGFSQAGLGQIKQSLGSNDQSRANCLYNPVTTTPVTPTH
ncbi:MAG: hypothetical protein ABIQ95_02460 [Bdellovibrionia bacterium]